MTHYISNSGKDERGKLSGGTAGDQTGKEWQLRSWYNRPWTCVLRHPDKAVRDKIAELGVAAARNNNVGYDQGQRGTYWKELQKAGYDPSKIDTPCEADCSAGVIANVKAVGHLLNLPKLKNLSATYTGNLRSGLKEAGFTCLTDKKYLTSPDYLLPGDILLYDGHHTATNISMGAKAEVIKTIPDLSHHHPVKDWDEFMESAQFVITKATQGVSGMDDMLDEVIRECEKRKKPYWLYAYLNKGGELEQTKYLVNICKPKVGEHFRGYCIDVEKQNEAANVWLAMSWLARTTGRCILYTGYKDYGLYKAIIADRPEEVAWWEARYGKDDGKYNPSYPPHDGVDLHQFTEFGECPGVPSKIDLNRLTGAKPLEWFTEKVKSPSKQPYSGSFPSLPPRGYYTIDDGMTKLTEWRDEIGKVQALINWITNGSLKVDGKYGKATFAAVKVAQSILKVTVDGEFGKQTLKAAKAYLK